MKKIVLGSSSPYRKSLLSKLIPQFDTLSPDIDESRIYNEPPLDLVTRLAREKYQAISSQYSEEVLVITSDQVACLDSCILGKPGGRENAIMQLTQFSGQCVQFLTSLYIGNTRTGEYRACVEPVDVKFRELTQQEIIAYIDIEKPFNCAGSFKSEGLGVCLFDSITSSDPNTLVGLPLIKLNQFLTELGYSPLLRW